MIRWLARKLLGARALSGVEGDGTLSVHHEDSEQPKQTNGHIGHRRQLCWWEPIYSPDLMIDSAPYDWDMDRDSGPSRRFILGSNLKERVVPGDTFKVEDVTFKECDFQGRFRPETLIMFDRCRFVSCDFAYSTWKDAHCTLRR